MADPENPTKPFFIYNRRGYGRLPAVPPYIYDTRGECIGFLEGQDVYTFDGEWVGGLIKDGRITRKRAGKKKPLHPNPPPKLKVKPSNLPARAPLPPQTGDLSYDTVDVMEEDPEIFKRLSDRRKDLGE